MRTEDLKDRYKNFINLKPHALRGFASTLYFFPKYINENKFSMPPIKLILTTGEVLFPAERNRITCKIIGGGIFENQLKNKARLLGLEDVTEFINNLMLPNSREVVRKEVQYCDVFLLCSFKDKWVYKEGIPVVLMEAQACGKPCINTFHAGIPEVVVNNKTGFLMPERAVADICNAMEVLYFNNSLRTTLGAQAADRVRAEFNHDI